MGQDEEMDRKKKMRINIIIIAILTLILGILVITSDGGNVYFKWGPNKNLHFISYTIDNWPKYIGVLVGIIPLAWIDIYSYDKLNPYFFSRIYLDDEIKDWKQDEKWQLAFWAELTYACSNFRSLLDILISVTNFYFALWRWFLKEILCIYFINDNLNSKIKRGLYGPKLNGQSTAPLLQEMDDADDASYKNYSSDSGDSNLTKSNLLRW